MAAYAIMRCKKLATMGCVASSLRHCYRERETPNADAERTPGNRHRAAESTGEAIARLRELLPEKRRKDAVLAVEYVMTASPEWWEKADQRQQARFFEQAHIWLANKYGAENIITATVHHDETSPHLSAFVVPLTRDGRLSAKEFIGNKGKMSYDQTTFAAAVHDLGLERGIEGSRARHQTIRAFYEGLEHPAVRHAFITSEDLKPQKSNDKTVFGRMWDKLGVKRYVETPEGVAERLTSAVHRRYEPAINAAAGAREMRQKAREAQETARDLRNRLKPILDALQPLNEENRQKVAHVFIVAGEKALAEQQRIEREKLMERQTRRKSLDHGMSR
jgi:hypothetical protein